MLVSNWSSMKSIKSYLMHVLTAGSNIKCNSYKCWLNPYTQAYITFDQVQTYNINL